MAPTEFNDSTVVRVLQILMRKISRWANFICCWNSEYILDEAKVSLEVTYIKGVPMPDELKVCSTVYNINQTMDWCIPIIYLVELSHSFKEKYELYRGYMVTYLMYQVECIYFLIKKNGQSVLVNGLFTLA